MVNIHIHRQDRTVLVCSTAFEVRTHGFGDAPSYVSSSMLQLEKIEGGGAKIVGQMFASRSRQARRLQTQSKAKQSKANETKMDRAARPPIPPISGLKSKIQQFVDFFFHFPLHIRKFALSITPRPS